MKRITTILFWSVISAAFIGPGTVTTAASAGASHGFQLLWALVFSTLACVVLQEAAARISIVSGKNLGEALKERYKNSPIRVPVLILIFGAIVFGSAAYEAGNILGAVAGVKLIANVPASSAALAIGVVAALLLTRANTKVIVTLLGFVVAFMGLLFLVTAITLKPNIGDVLSGAAIPSFPTGSSLLILSLVGTTVVPYNLFLGSGVGKGQSLADMRIGLPVAIILGGLISAAILITGTAISGTFTFDALGYALADRFGSTTALFFAAGLFAAGLSSAITAPLASGITAQGLFSSPETSWAENTRPYKLLVLGVLLTGIAFAAMETKPVAAIVLAQALNGIVLPFAAVFLWITVNDNSLLGADQVNSTWLNLLTAFVVWVSIILGLNNLWTVASSQLGLAPISELTLYPVMGVLSLAVVGGVWWRIGKE